MEISEYLQEKGWEKKINEKDERVYYEKKGNLMEGLQIDNQLFKNLGKKRIIRLEDLLQKVKIFFQNKDYELLPSDSIINRQRNTLFIGAGVQVVYNRLIEDNISFGRSYFIAQPSIRVNALEKVGVKEGYSTSFVNICSEQVGIEKEDHLHNLENWFDFLSQNGLYTGHIKLIEDPTWRGGDFPNGESLLIYYGGLQIGDAVFISGENKKIQKNLTISDIGLGLERLCWALNKSTSYYDIIGPFFEIKCNGVIPLDMLRSTTLMAISGIEPSNKDVGYRFKQFIKKYIEHNKKINPLFEINYYFDFWRDLIDKPKSIEQVRNVVIDEIHKQLIQNIVNKLKIKIKTNNFHRFEDFINECLIKSPESIREIERFLSE